VCVCVRARARVRACVCVCGGGRARVYSRLNCIYLISLIVHKERGKKLEKGLLGLRKNKRNGKGKQV